LTAGSTAIRAIGESTKHGPLVHGPPPWTSKYGLGPWNPNFTTPSKQRPLDEQLKYVPLHKTVNERTSSEAGANPAILKIQYLIKQMAPRFITELHGLHPQIPSPKTTPVNSQPQTQKKSRPSIIDSGDGN